MRLVDAFSDLLAFGQPVFETREAAARLRITSPHAVKVLRAAEAAGLARRLRRGLWTLERDLDPFTVAPYLTAPLPAYVSMWSALAHHGMIEQIPARVYVVSLDHAKTVETTVGSFEIHHIAPELFDGFDNRDGRALATPEKALFDTVYLQAQRGRAYFPELSIPADLDASKIEAWTEAVTSPRLRTLTNRELKALAAQ